jgi:predicted AAA+ superfamily ATPase
MMKRCIDYDLYQWKISKSRKPLLLRGARQVGKTYAVRQLGKTFESFVEVNFERTPAIRAVFEKDLLPERIKREISLITGKEIIVGKTLLFFDEIQNVPQAILALRYFYEEMPELHVIGAGSLLDFAIEQVGIPVGRVTSLYLYPLSFIEFLFATNHSLLAEEILKFDQKIIFSEPVHNKLLQLVGFYLAVGGMPEAVKCWQETNNISACIKIHNNLLDAYRQDFEKYAKKLQIKYLKLLFDHIPLQLGEKFKYSSIDGDYRKRELAPSLDLLVTAGVVHKVFATDAHGIPLGAQVNPQYFKVLFLDVALSQSVLGMNLNNWFLDPLEEFVNKGPLVEAFVGQELLAYSNSARKEQLYYWQKFSRGSEAEVDYVAQDNESIIPIEVKSGVGTTLKSMHQFLETHPRSPYGIRISTLEHSEYQKIISYPLYAVVQVLKSHEEVTKKI